MNRWMIVLGTILIVLTSWVYFKSSGNKPEIGGLAGNARIIDGDTIAFGKERVRFLGIDAPEKKQTCICNDSKVNCGKMATLFLTRLINGYRVRCDSTN